MEKKNIIVLGDGGWGTALAILLDRNGHQVTLWSNFPDYAEYLKGKRENTRFLPGVKIPKSIIITDNLKLTDPSLGGVNLIVMAIPTQYARVVLARLKPHLAYLTSHIPIVSVAKGLEMRTLRRPSQIISEVLKTERIAVLSGPSHAEEVSRRLPTSVVIASRHQKLATEIQHIFINDYFRPYTHPDVVGVELGGALKNIIAIAAGICDGLKLGDNAKSALLTRGLVEMIRLARRLGAQETTLTGLAGMGDLIATCISPHSRNRSVGMQLGQGKELAEIMGKMQMVAEGVWTTRAVVKLSKQLKVELPITKEVYNVLFHNKDPRQAVLDLMRRPPKSEA